MRVFSEDETDEDCPFLFREFIRGCLFLACLLASGGFVLFVLFQSVRYAVKATLGAL